MRIVFCGVGALGSNAVLFCRNLGAEMALVDFDRVESKNLLAQAFVKQSVGKNKADALKLQLANFHGIRLEAHGVRLEAGNVDTLCGSADLLVDAFDNAASRELLSAFARRAGKALVHAAISADGSFGMVRWDAGFVADSEDEPGQATCEGGEHLPMIALVAATLGRAIEDFVAGRGEHDWMVSRSGVARMG
jgi:hypothetical protein